jgi:hypothetical protein
LSLAIGTDGIIPKIANSRTPQKATMNNSPFFIRSSYRYLDETEYT